MRTLRLLAPILLLVAVTPAHAQRAGVTGIVVDSISGRPLEGVRVVLVDLRVSTVTDSKGSFQFYGLQSGQHTLTARRLGYEPAAIRFQLNAAVSRQADLGTLRLASAPVELDPIVVEAEIIANYPQMEGFFRRMKSEHGTFLTEADIQRKSPPETSHLIRKIPGFQTDEFGAVWSNRGSGGLRFPTCGVQYYINGVKVNAPTIDVVQPEAIVGMELYTGSSTIPAVYRSQSNAQCGVIAIWTRHTRR